MSMLSAQIDKLRALADRMDGIVPNTPDELRDAADTIWQLRDDLQRANAENAKLRGLLRDVWWHMVSASWHEDSPNPSAFVDRMRELGVEVDG